MSLGLEKILGSSKYKTFEGRVLISDAKKFYEVCIYLNVDEVNYDGKRFSFDYDEYVVCLNKSQNHLFFENYNFLQINSC